MKTVFKGLFILLSLFYMVTLSPVFANEFDGPPFEVAPIIPGNQTNPSVGYFDLNVFHNYKQTIYITVKNNKKQPIVVKVTPFNAITSNTGDIVYDVNASVDRYSNLKVNLNQYITNERRIRIPANSSVKVPMNIHLPNIKQGLVLGGIHVIAENQTFNQQSVKKGTATFQINNQIAYVIGVKLQFPKIVPPEFSFGKTSVDMQYGAPKLFIEMKNSAPAVIKDLSGTYAVFDKKGNKILYGSFSKMRMAPNTRFEYPIDWVSGKVQPGTYTVKLTAKADGKSITAEREFTIKETKQIQDFNNTRKEVKPPAEQNAALPWWIYLLIVVFVGFIFFIIGRKSRKDEKKD